MNQIKKIEVLFIIDHLDAGGGTQNILANLVKGLKNINYIPTVVSLNGGDKQFIEDLRNEHIEVHVYRKFYLWFWGLPKLFHLIRSRNYSIIQNLLLYSNIVGRIIGRIAGAPIVVSSTWGDGHTLKTWEIWLDRITNKLDDRIVVNSKAGYEFCVEKFKIDKKKIQLIYNGVEMPPTDFPENLDGLRKNFSIPEDKIIVGAIGRLSEEKGYQYLLDAFHSASQEIENLLLIIVGSGKMKNKLKYQVDKLNIGNKVIFINYVKEVKLFYYLIDIFILSSLSEGLPNVILEAMFYEKPIIATSVGDIPRIIENGISGLLVPPKDSQNLSEAMIRLASDKEFCQKLVLESRKKAKNSFSLDQMIKSFDELYNDILAKR